MNTVIGVRFRQQGRMYYFNPGSLLLHKDDYVIVETARGVEYGQAVTDIRLADEADYGTSLRPVIRKATPEDQAAYEHNLELEKEAFDICVAKIKEHNMNMKLLTTEYTFDGRKVLFYFTADGRVDFRDLVKDLATSFHTRIELRQIGLRDETRLGGGIGICGRPYCCHTFLSDFAPVSIKMAKDQNLSLNPTKISGTCGRLMCCLRYEESTYEELTKNLPSEGDLVETQSGTGEVLHVNVLRQLVKVGIAQEKGDVLLKEFPLEEIKIVKHHFHRGDQDLDEKERRQLKELEKESQ